MSEIRVRKRDFPPTVVQTRLFASDSVPTAGYTNITLSSVSQKTTDEIGNGWGTYRELLRRNAEGTKTRERLDRLDIGGGFRSELNTTNAYYRKVYTSDTQVNFRIGKAFYIRGRVGPRLDTLTTGEGSKGPLVTDDMLLEVAGMGGRAISKTTPTNSVADVSNFLGEVIRDGIPSFIGSNLLKDRIHFFRSIGSDYLNVEFGWKPFLRDLQKVFLAVRDSDKILQQYERNSGRPQRRKYRFPTVRIDSTLYTNKQVQTYPLGSSYHYADLTGYGTQSGNRVVTKDYWFSGEYTYYLGQGSNALSRKIHKFSQDADKLLGLKITPEVLWNLAPWSWLADWVLNMGDVLRNLSSFSANGLVMRYGYIMADIAMTDEHTTSGCTWGNGTTSGHASITKTSRVKLRQRATPYGFGLDPSVDFTAQQAAIIAALGLSHGSRIGW